MVVFFFPPSVRILISSSPSSSLFAFGFRASRRYRPANTYILQIGIVCVYVDQTEGKEKLRKSITRTAETSTERARADP